MPITLDGTLGITTPALTVTGATVNTGGISTAGNLTFTSTGERLLADMTNATLTSRFAIQTSTTNGSTNLHLIPNGTSTSAGLKLEGDASMANGSRFTFDNVGGSDNRIGSGVYGTGSYLPITFYNGGSERMRIDTSGNVMTGVTTALGKFSVAGGTYQIALHDGAGSSSSFGYLNYGGSTGAMILNAYSTGGSTYQAFYTSNAGVNAERARIHAAGGLSVGTTSNYSFFNVVGAVNYGTLSTSGYFYNGSGASTNIMLQGSASSYGVALGVTGNDMQFYTGAAATWSERMRITSTGNVGIGTTVPGGSATDRQLTVQGSTSAQISAWNGSAYVANFGLNSSSVGYLEVTGANPFTFYTNGSERMRIDSSGNVGIGSTSPLAKLQSYSSTGYQIVASGYTVVGGSARAGAGSVRLGASTDYCLLLDNNDAGSTIATVRNTYGATDANAILQIQSGTLVFGTGTSYTERMRITAQGNYSFQPAYSGTLSSGSYATLISNVSGTIGTAIKIYGHLSENGIVNCSFGEWIAVSDGTNWTLNLISQAVVGSSYGTLNIQFSGNNLQIKSGANQPLGQYRIVIEIYR